MKYLKIFSLLFRSFRMKEILLMTGFSIIGVVFTNPENWLDFFLNLKVFFFILLYVMSVFFLNSYAGYAHDRNSKRLRVITVVPRSIYLYLLIFTTILFSIVSYSVNSVTFYLCIGSLFLWILYYSPPIHLKSKFFGGTIAHFIGGITHFHMGYTGFEEINMYSFLVSVFFSLLLCVGHYNHEILDYDSDRNSGVTTTTVIIGIRKGYYFRTIFIVIAIIYLITIYFYSYIDATTLLIFGICTTLLLITSLILKERNPELFMKISRLIVFISCFVFIICLIYLNDLFYSLYSSVINNSFISK